MTLSLRVHGIYNSEVRSKASDLTFLFYSLIVMNKIVLKNQSQLIFSKGICQYHNIRLGPAFKNG